MIDTELKLCQDCRHYLVSTHKEPCNTCLEKHGSLWEAIPIFPAKESK